MSTYDDAESIREVAGEDIIDTRDLQGLIDRLDAREDDDEDPLSVAETELLAALCDLRDEVGDEWPHGVTLIAERHFTEYARQFAEDIGAIDDNARWPATCIDWVRAAGELRMDYASTEFGGVTYFFR